MKIIKYKGNHFDGDIRYHVTMEEEAFSIVKFCILNNYMGMNESKRIKNKYPNKDLPLFFLTAMVESIKMGAEGIDFREWLNNKDNFDKWCDKYCIRGEVKKRAWNEIINEIQVDLNGFTEEI